MRRLTALLPVAIALALLWSAPARAQSRGKEIVVGFGAEPRTMLAVTIVDWTTNNMLEHIYDRLLDRDAKTFKPRPMLHRVEDRQRHDVGVQAPAQRQVPQRRAVHGGLREGDDRLCARPREQEPLRHRGVLGPRQRGAGRRRLHGALRDQTAVAEPPRHP